jgi:hypothetical protein
MVIGDRRVARGRVATEPDGGSEHLLDASGTPDTVTRMDITLNDQYVANTPQLLRLASLGLHGECNYAMTLEFAFTLDHQGSHILIPMMWPERVLSSGLLFVRCYTLLKREGKDEPFCTVLDVPVAELTKLALLYL